MPEAEKNPKVDAWLARETRWADEFAALRDIALKSGLSEGFKWGQACYTLDDSNVFLIHGFKEYCALLFMKGALMSDPQGLLIQQTENVQSARQMRFTNSGEIGQLAPAIAAYMAEAIELEKSGAKVVRKTTAEFSVPDELKNAFDQDRDFKIAFEALTPGRQRAWILQFSGAKQAKTREARIEKARPAIAVGKGPQD